MNKLWKSHEQLMNKSQKKCEQAVSHKQSANKINRVWTSNEHVMNKSWATHEQATNKVWTSFAWTSYELGINKSQTKCKQVVYEQVMSLA